MSLIIEKQFRETLQKNNLYITPERMCVFQIIKSHSSPCSVSKLVGLTQNYVDRSTVYRTLDLFEQIGVINRVYNGWKYTIELSDRFSSHHHHMTCTNCGQVTSFHEPPSLTKELEKIEKLFSFHADSHNLEFTGQCTKCV